ncbi:protein translocase subunit SecF [Alkalicaulis satelles]|uniref:Protein-export membrane protein SecF n=1 Tax=Alkalicaulis satelles TaxID=2609175 RepID=A0A5M6ZIV2_9PROT|nr:protein translocase subunit SecF [Alkalicaulis satelles]KAA5804746.1 protein translocase subunit SecF [Alkalicaulis satelles]
MNFFPFVRLLPVETRYQFIRMRVGAFILSMAMILGSVGAFFTFGLNLGIDFRGGTVIALSTAPEPADLGEIRTALGALNLGDVQVQEFGGPSDVLVRVAMVDVDTAERVTGAPVEDFEAAQQAARRAVQGVLNDTLANVEYLSIEVVGPQVSGELVVAGTTAVIVALVLMLLYIWFRFEWQFSVGAVLALIHDVILTIGFFAVTQLEFNLPTIAAILTIVGYSMNDTVVVYDRIREMFRKYKTKPTAEVLDIAINATLSRTILTSGTTLVAILSMAIIGGPALEGFALALIWGVAIGTYSSIFVAAPLLTLTGVKRDSGEEEGARAHGV